MIARGRRRIEELAATERCSAVDADHEAGPRPTTREEVLDHLRDGWAERREVPPHIELTGSSLDQGDRRVALVRLIIVPRRSVDSDRPLERVAKRVLPQELTPDRRILEAPHQ